MASELLSLADASALLGVSAERVRQLVVAGVLPAVRFGNAWAVPRESVVARQQASNRKGRPLSARRAWESILVGEVDLLNVSRYRNRGELHRYEMSVADVEFLSGHEAVVVSGVAGAVELGELLQPEAGDADLYVRISVWNQLLAEAAAVLEPLGRVVVRVVPDEVWHSVEESSRWAGDEGRRVAPRAAVALDLIESGDPRHWVAAEHLMESDD